jgi:hypothetical protein
VLPFHVKLLHAISVDEELLLLLMVKISVAVESQPEALVPLHV